jgi:hypothetical protein
MSTQESHASRLRASTSVDVPSVETLLRFMIVYNSKVHASVLLRDASSSSAQGDELTASFTTYHLAFAKCLSQSSRLEQERLYRLCYSLTV